MSDVELVPEEQPTNGAQVDNIAIQSLLKLPENVIRISKMGKIVDVKNVDTNEVAFRNVEILHGLEMDKT